MGVFEQVQLPHHWHDLTIRGLIGIFHEIGDLRRIVKDCLFEDYVVRASNVQLMVDGWAIFTVLRVMLGSKRRSWQHVCVCVCVCGFTRYNHSQYPVIKPCWKVPPFLDDFPFGFHPRLKAIHFRPLWITLKIINPPFMVAFSICFSP